MEKTIVLIDAGFLSKLSKYFGAGNAPLTKNETKA